MRFALPSRARTVPLLAVPAVLGSVLVPVLLATAPAADAAVAAPGPSNTGHKHWATLTRINGDVSLDKAGATYRNLDIHGRVRVNAPNITLLNSVIRGNAVKTENPIIDCNYGNTNHKGFILRNSTITAQYPSAYQAGILGHDFTLDHVEITKTVDGVDVVGGNVTVKSSWIHDTYFVAAANSPLHRDTHNDGVQVMSGTNILISGNTISGNRNAALMVAQNAGVASGVRFTGNWSSGGACTVNISPTPRSTINGLSITGNRFLHDTTVQNCAIIWGRGATVAYSGNIWRDTGRAVVATRGY